MDGTLAHICYCVLFFFGYHVFSKSRQIKWIFTPLIVCGAANALIAFFSFIGVNMIDTAIIKVLLGVPANAVATNTRAFVSTFGNPNYLSGFGGVLFAVFFTRLMFSEPVLRSRGAGAKNPRDVNSTAAAKSAPAATSTVAVKSTPAAKSETAAKNIPAAKSSVTAKSASAVKPSAETKNTVSALSRRGEKNAARTAGAKDSAAAATAPPTAARAGYLHKLPHDLKNRIVRPVFIQNVISFFMIIASFSIVVTSLSSSGFFTFVVMTPVIITFAFLRGASLRKAVLASASLLICALIFLPLASMDDTVMEETFGLFKTLTADAKNGDLEPAMSTGDSPIYAGARSTDAAIINRSGDFSPLQSPVQPDGLLFASRSGENALSDTVPVLLSYENIASAQSLFSLSAGGAVSSPPLFLLSGGVTAIAPDGKPYSTDFNLPAHFPEPAISPGTGRLYIWRETLKLIAKKPILGYGMDTLSYAFPQNRLEKVAGIGDYAVFVTKPHNMFIGYAYGAGVPALLAFLLFNAFAAAAFLRYFFKRGSGGEKPDVTVMCAFLGWLAYLVQGFVNDALISTSPLWWALFGAGAGLLPAARDAAQPDGAADLRKKTREMRIN
jgi:hypothetical protein